MTPRDWLWRSAFHDREIAPMVEAWMRTAFESLRQDMTASAGALDETLRAQSAQGTWSWEEIATAGATAAVSVAPFAILPFAGSLATVTATSFFVFTTSAVSIPILTAVLGMVAVGGIVSTEFRNRQIAALRKRYLGQVVSAARSRILGPEAGNAAASLRGLLLGEVDRLTRARLEATR